MLRNGDSALRLSHLRSFLNEVLSLNAQEYWSKPFWRQACSLNEVLSLNAQEYLAEEMADVIICLPQ